MTNEQTMEMVDELLEDLHSYIKGEANRLYYSGGVDPAEYGDHYILPKILVKAALKNAIDRCDPLSSGSCYGKLIEQVVDNLKHF